MKNKKLISKIASLLSLSIISHSNTYGNSLQKVFIPIVGIVGGQRGLQKSIAHSDITRYCLK